ncbi:MAG: glucosyl transferase, partial [Calditrichia bacterium]
SRNGKILAESGYQNTTTLDTTRHNFDWQKYTIESPFGSGVLYDVAIINENDIWAVGEIYADSTQPGLLYNAVHWKDQQWMLMRIPYIYNGSPFISRIKWIYAINEHDIWFGNSVHWDGLQFENVDIAISIFSGIGINKMWSNSEDDFFVVGNDGTIARSTDHGLIWSKIESETDLNFKDVWGSWNEKQGNMEVIAVASELFVSPDRLIYRLSPDQAVLSDEPIVWPLSTIWFISGRRYYVGGSGLYEKRTLKEPNWKNGPQEITTNYIFRIRGTGLNNIIAVGGYGEVLHYNGISWKSFYGETQISGNYYSVDVTDDIVVTVGYDSPNAVIIVGRRIFGK